MLAFIIKAAAEALKAFPTFNLASSLDGDNLVLKSTTTSALPPTRPNGLVVPVIKDADKKGLDIAGTDRPVALARRQARPTDMRGATFTIFARRHWRSWLRARSSMRRGRHPGRQESR